MKTKRKQDDLNLYNLFKDYSTNDEECDKMINDAEKAFMMLKTDKVFRERSSGKEGL